MMKGKNWPREEYMVADGSGEMRAMTKAEIKQKWDFGRDDAGNRGTYMHSLKSQLNFKIVTVFFI